MKNRTFISLKCSYKTHLKFKAYIAQTIEFLIYILKEKKYTGTSSLSHRLKAQQPVMIHNVNFKMNLLKTFGCKEITVRIELMPENKKNKRKET